ncbi:MAG: DUF1538 domain-containing protein [Clostridiales bacterium]|nr:DUF1538 domain-containing protein [Clostridiales bacterium]
MNRKLKEKIAESFLSVVPVTAIVLALSAFLVPVEIGAFALFLAGAAMLIVGMGFFQLGTEMAMEPIGEGIGVTLTKSRRLIVVIAISAVMGFITTVAEPDLQVLADQTPVIPDQYLIFAIAAGVAVCFALAVVRSIKRFSLHWLLVGLYVLLFIFAIFVPGDFIAVAFDSGGVTTGPMTVPFIMAVGVGLVSLRGDKDAAQDGFGLVALSSVGPILAVMILGVFFRPTSSGYEPTVPAVVSTTRDVAREFGANLPETARHMISAVLPIILAFIALQLITRRFKRNQGLRVVVGFVYTFLGLTLFLTGANTGFLPIGHLFGASIAASEFKWLLIPFGMIIGFFIVRAEPAVAILNREVEEMTNGRITRGAMGMALSAGVAVSVGLAMTRVLTGIGIMWLLVPGYLIAIVLAFVVPKIFVGIAFDSGGVASGPMTSAFLLPLSIGASDAVGGNVLNDAFGVVAMVAMTPLIAIQIMGLIYDAQEKRAERQLLAEAEAAAEPMDEQEEEIIDFEDETAETEGGDLPHDEENAARV